MSSRRVQSYVYIVRCADGSLYTGTARDIDARIAMHNAGRGAKYTRSRGPVVVVLREGPMTVSRALRREHQLKQLTRAKKEALVAGALTLGLPRVARKRKKARPPGGDRARARPTAKGAVATVVT